MNPIRLTSVSIVAAALVLGGMRAASAQTIANGDFETAPTYGGQGYPYVSFNTTTTTASFTWTGYSGVFNNSSNNSSFGPPATTSGAQFAFLQGFSGTASSITQTITGFTSGQTYTISGLGAQRSGNGLGGQTLNFTLFGTTNAVTPTSTTAFNAFTTGPFVATSNSATFVVATGVTAGDHTAYFDKLTINSAAAPEPSSFAEIAAFALPALGLMVGTRRRRRTIG